MIALLFITAILIIKCPQLFSNPTFMIFTTMVITCVGLRVIIASYREPTTQHRPGHGPYSPRTIKFVVDEGPIPEPVWTELRATSMSSAPLL